ncbi:hypothetical protein NDU88_005458 [Pleurodeles waltl]|uniref:Uncharacterized protein n=1 Tax=Pleurodeles waltl TaxID=8319 RepID=A0AAV7TVK3_PLEWA|nr:hypothetical protein NDU88_005458 [Pleurodeles waltl]
MKRGKRHRTAIDANPQRANEFEESKVCTPGDHKQRQGGAEELGAKELTSILHHWGIKSAANPSQEKYFQDHSQMEDPSAIVPLHWAPPGKLFLRVKRHKNPCRTCPAQAR